MVTSDPDVAERAGCMTDCCGYFWSGRKEDFRPFASQSSRASEFEGAMLNVQLDRLDGLIARLRSVRKRLLDRTQDVGLSLSPANSPQHDCATCVLYRFESADEAGRFAEAVPAGILADTGRHTYTEWDPILNRRGAHHPAMDPFRMPANKGCRMDYSPDMCSRSLDILARTVLVGLRPSMGDVEIDDLAERIRAAAQVAEPGRTTSRVRTSRQPKRSG